MGSAASKANRAAAKSAADTTRRYPTKPNLRPVNPITPSKTTGPASTLRASSPGPTIHPEAHAAERRDAAIDLDASDPDLALNARMRQLGPVQPNPTMSNSSTFNLHNRPPAQNPNKKTSSQFRSSPSAPMQTLFPNPSSNPAVTLLEARKRIVEEAEREFEDVGRLGKGRRGRRFLDVGLMRKILILRDEKGVGSGEIEEMLGLDRGVVERLGGRGIVGVAG